MRNIDNWDAIEERQEGEFVRPVPGGYIAVIVNVEDVEKKEYLKVEWDFADGEYKGYNAETFNSAGFWPTALIRSYKEKALGFFKAFKTSVEMSNPGYAFDCAKPQALAGKGIGVVLGEEEYVKGNGDIATRLYVYQVRTVKAIKEKDYKVPELKRLKNRPAPAPVSQFTPMDDYEEEFPF